MFLVYFSLHSLCVLVSLYKNSSFRRSLALVVLLHRSLFSKRSSLCVVDWQIKTYPVPSACTRQAEVCIYQVVHALLLHAVRTDQAMYVPEVLLLILRILLLLFYALRID